MYFYCWVEICTDDIDCAQTCAIICEYHLPPCALYVLCVFVVVNLSPLLTASEGERKRRETMSESNQVHLVSLGPLLLGQKNTQQEENPCVKQNTSKSESEQTMVTM